MLPKKKQDNRMQPRSLREVMNQLFEESVWDPFSSRSMDSFFEGMPEFSDKNTPNIDVSENKKGMKIKASLPGYDVKDIDLDVEDALITISGETKEEKTDKDEKFHRKEISTGSFYRSIPLPAKANIDKAVAEMEKGMLTIEIPWKKTTAKKKAGIKIKGK